MSEFQPQVAQINSAVTPEQGVVDTAAVELFADVAEVATKAAFSFTGQQELTELGSTFERITQARQAGGNSSALQVKARAALDTTKANSPWVAAEADKLFSSTFGGGGSGVFKATPEEEAREKHLQKVEEKRLALGLSTSEEAQKRISLDENAKSVKIQADAQKDVREYNGEVVFTSTQAQLNNNSIKFMDAMNRTMSLSGGTLSNDSVRSLSLTVDQTVLQLKQQLNGQTRDPETGHLLIDKAGYDANLKEIEDWANNTKAMVSDNAYMKVIQDLNTEQNAEINFIATSKYRTLKELSAAGGQAAVSAYLVAARTKDGAAKQLLIGANPIAKEMFKQSGSYKQASAGGMDKIVLPSPDNTIMSQPEAMATGTMLNDPQNEKLIDVTVEKVATEPSAVGPYKSMLKQNPDSSALVWSGRFKAWKTQNPSKADDVLTHSMDALKNSFLSSYVSDTGGLPQDFSISGRTREERKFGRDVIRLNVVSGEGLTKETGKILTNMLRVLSNNPDYAAKRAKEMGFEEDISPQELVRAIVLGKSPEPKVPDKPVKSKVQSLDASGNKGGNVVDSIIDFLSKPGANWSSDLKAKAQETLSLLKDTSEVKTGSPSEPLTSSVEDVKPSFMQTVRDEENDAKAGFDEASGLWTPHSSVEGGKETIAYGHKLKEGEDFSGGITEEEALRLFEQDFSEAQAKASKVKGYKELPEKYQLALDEIAFNIGSVSEEEWPKLVKAMREGDDKEVMKQLSRTFLNPSTGKMEPLTKRVGAIADALDL